MFDTIYFDMDGTIANLYGYPQWEPKLRNSDVSPYLDCEPLVNMEQLNNIIQQFKAMGVTCGVISWSSMDGSHTYNQACRKCKRDWIKRHCPDLLDDFHVVKYGTPKHRVSKSKNSILVDDNKSVRDKWPYITIDASNPESLLENLENLLDTLRKVC